MTKQSSLEQFQGNTIEYWRANAEENYVTTPISVLRYITVLEEQVEQLRKHAVSGSAVCVLGDMLCKCKSRKYEDFLKDGCEHYR